MQTITDKLADALRKTLPFLDTLYGMTKNAPTAFVSQNAEEVLAEYDARFDLFARKLYTQQTFITSPEWDDLSDDARNRWRRAARALLEEG